MPKRINVTGLGVIEFPDGMDDAAISHAIESDILPNNVGNVARSRLQAQGLTPQDVKAGRGVTTPDQIQTQEPKRVNGGFAGGLFSNPLAGPMEALGTRSAEVQMGDDATLAGLKLAADVIVPRPDKVYQEAMRRGAAHESTSDMYGQVAQAAALSALGPAKGAYGKMRGLSEGEAAAKAGAAVTDAAADPTLKQMVGKEIIESGQRMKNPKADIPILAEKKIAGIDTDSAIANRQMPAKVGPILQQLADARREMFDANGTARLGFEDKIKSISATMKDIARKSDAQGNIPPDALRNLHADLNYEVGPDGFDQIRAANTNTERLSPTMHAAKAVIDTVNEDPAAAAANTEKSQWIHAKNELPKNAPDTTPRKLSDLSVPDVLRTARNLTGKGVVAGTAYAIGGPIAGTLVGAAEAAAPYIKRILTSPSFRTASAIKRAQIGRMISAGDYVGAAKEVGLGIGAADLQNTQRE